MADFLHVRRDRPPLSWPTDIETIAPLRKGRVLGPSRRRHARVMHCSYSQSTFDRPHFITYMK
jgi:hypothetical protein